MSDVSKVAGGSVQSLESPDQLAGKQRKDIHEKQKGHHNFHSAHDQAADKERLRKLLNDVEKMLAEQHDDEGAAAVKDDLKRMNGEHVKSSLKSVREQFGLSADKEDKVEQSSNIVDADRTLATRGDMVLSGGISVLYLFMDLLSGLAQYKYLEMQQKAKVSRDAQNQANRVQEQIAFVSKQSDPDTHKVDLDKGVIKYMRENDIKIDGKTIDDYLGGDPKNPNKLDKGGLDAVKSALENASNRASDFVSQSQLQLQKVMQTYNVTVSLINSMQTMLEEMNKSIAQNVR